MNKSTHTRRSVEPRRTCAQCRHSVPLTALNDDDLCTSCAEQGALFDLTPGARPRRHDGRWL